MNLLLFFIVNKNLLFIFNFVYMCVCVYKLWYVDAYRIQKTMLDPLHPELQVALRFWELGSKHS